MKSLNIVLALFVVSLLTPSFGSAQAPSVEIQEKARKRLYPGGQDEGDLKVLPQVPEPGLKINKKSVQADVVKSMTGQATEPASGN